MAMRMRPSADPRAPGIYQSFDSVAPPPLSIANTRITGFVGITQKGPMNEATRLANWDEFVEIFGYDDRARTPSDSVLRLLQERRHRLLGRARRALRAGGRAARASSTRRAPSTSRSTTGTSRRSRSARSTRARGATTSGSGACTRRARKRCSRATSTSAPGEAHVNVTRGFEVGALVRIYDRENSDFVVITEVGDKVDQVGDRDAGQPAPSRGRADVPRGDDVRDPRRDAGSPRGVQGPADASVVAQLRAARGRAAQSRLVRLEDLGTKSPVPHNMPEPLAMTRLTGGRDGIETITPEDFIGHDTGPGERAGLHGARRERGGRDPRRARRDEVLRARARSRGRAQGAAAPGPDDLDLREPEGSVRDPRHPAEQGHRVGPAVAAPHRLVVLRVLLAVAPGRRARTTRPRSSRRPGTSPAATPGAIEDGVHHAPANLEIAGVRGRLPAGHRGPHRDPQQRRGEHVPAPARASGRGAHALRHPIPSGATSRSAVFSSCCGGPSRRASPGPRSSPTPRRPGIWSSPGPTHS